MLLRVKLFRLALTVVVTLSGLSPARAETGYDLWLRYVKVEDPARLAAYRTGLGSLVIQGASPTFAVIRAEVKTALTGLLDRELREERAPSADGVLIIGTAASSPLVAGLGWSKDLEALASDGFIIRSTTVAGRRAVVVAARTDVGALYGTFHLIRTVQTGQPIDRLDIRERPRISLRFLNHWDNLDGTIERGYGGRSMWNNVDVALGARKRLIDYARANASLGINAATLNNVNANPLALDAPYLEKAKAIADLWRPYGIRAYLSANFAAPRTLGKLETADPLDPGVAAWWKAKSDEIYRAIPDFGGFIVKANSEGQPGPQDYGRTHAEGANVLADAVAPHGGIVIWRAFVYNPEVDPDRIKRAHLEFVPLDGKFRDNVMVQVKNGPLDFQPREPFSPLFGATPKTPLVAELQLAQEYLGHSTHLVYLAPMWKEVLDADTYAKGPGSTVAKVIDGSVYRQKLTAIAGVSNTGSDLNWTGHLMAQANWYAYGRLAWNPELTSEGIADEWIRMTWGPSEELREGMRSLMMESREAFLDYTMPLGLHHLIGGDHYAPMPENNDLRRVDWSATTYHRADEKGVGYDRSPTGSNAVAQYNSPLKEQWAIPATTPDRLLLWFHHLPWDFPMKSGQTLWDELVAHYTRGALWARGLEARWAKLRRFTDFDRFDAVLVKLHQQSQDAAVWRDKCLRYFAGFSRKRVPPLDVPAPSGAPTTEAVLKTLAPAGMLIGAAINRGQLDGTNAAEQALVAKHFSSITPENLLKWGLVHPEPDRYDFGPADRYVEFGTANRMFIVGHTLLWHNQTPAWVFQGTDGGLPDRATLLARLKDHIEAVVGRYKGRIHGWDVVNEALNEDGTMRPTVWYKVLGEDYIAQAFEFAHAADPDAQLYYNDFNLAKPMKRAGALRIARQLKEKGVRIDGIGEQGHWLIDSPSAADLEATITDLASSGLRVHITELDVDVLPRQPGMEGADLAKATEFRAQTNLYPESLPPAMQTKLAQRYAEMFRLFLKHRDEVARVTFWGVSDAQTWLNNFPVRGRTNHPLLWDRKAQPKPAFDAVVDVLRTAPR